MEKKYNLLFVCLGNICRSPAAEGVFKQIINDNDSQDEFGQIDSAGIGNWHVGQLPDSRMRSCGDKRGYRFDSKARQFQVSDFDRFDYILIMDQDNYRMLSHLARNERDTAKLHYLSDYINDHSRIKYIPDPYYGDMADFNYALDLIEKCCNGLYQHLRRR